MTWASTTLGDAGVWVSGGTPSTSNIDYWDGDIPWMSSKSLKDFQVKDSDRRLTDLGVRNGTKLVPRDSILMVVRGMSLKTEFRMGITHREVALSQDLKALLPSDRFDPLFLAYAIRAKTADILDMVDEAGHGTGRLQTDRLFGLELPVPPIGEQQGIAATLGALDDKIESNRRAIFIASDLLDAIADRVSLELGSVPLSEIATVTRSTVDPERLGGEQVDHFSLPSFDDGVWPERVPAASIMSIKLVLDGSSILISRLNPRFNRTWWVVPERGITALASTEFSCLSAETRSDLAALWLAVRDRLFREEITHRVTGTSGSHQRIRPDDLLSIEVPDTRQLSDDVKQQALDLLDLINNRRCEIRRLAAIRDTLLPELLSGRIRVPEARKTVQEVVV